MNDDDEILSIKILVVGESGVGKTSFIRRYVKGCFTDNYKATIGVDFSQKQLNWKGKQLHLQFWDLIGQERLNTQIQGYFRGAMGAICIYDISDEKTKRKILDWRDLLNERCIGNNGEESHPPIILVGNKSDLFEVSLEDGEMKTHDYINDFAIKLGFIGGIAASAKNNIAVNEVIIMLLNAILEHNEKPESVPYQSIELKIPETKENKCCY